MRTGVWLLVAFCALVGARAARSAASEMAASVTGPAQPFAPDPQTAPLLSLGYREAAADLFYVRMIGYFIDQKSTGDGVGDLAEAVVALDPQFQRVYEHAANAMTLARHRVDQDVVLRAIALLESGIKRFPAEWRMPYLAGQMYTQDLQTDDPVLRRQWDERGLALVESAIRKPGAPASAASWTAMMHTKLGAHERAVANLKEMLLLTTDPAARRRLIATLAQLVERDASAVEAEIIEQRNAFERKWNAERRTLPATLYILVGERLAPGFDMTDLATGGRDLFVADDEANLPLEPLE